MAENSSNIFISLVKLHSVTVSNIKITLQCKKLKTMHIKFNMKAMHEF